MGLFERMQGNLMRSGSAGHHGGYQSGRQGGPKHGGFGAELTAGK